MVVHLDWTRGDELSLEAVQLRLEGHWRAEPCKRSSCVWSGPAAFGGALTPWYLQVLVWKEIRYGRMSEKEKSMLVSEVNILRELKHPNIVRYKVRICSSVPCARVQHASGFACP